MVQIERTLDLAPSFRSALETKAMIHWVLNDVTSALDAIREAAGSLNRDHESRAGSTYCSPTRANVVNLTTLTRLFLESMVARGSGHILKVASLVGYFTGGPGWAAYVASKSYLMTLTRGLAAELKGTGISATALAPGSTSTDFVRASGGGRNRNLPSASALVGGRSRPGWLPRDHARSGHGDPRGGQQDARLPG